MATKTNVDLDSMDAEALAELIARANTVRASRQEAELAERRRVAMTAATEAIRAIPSTEAAMKHADAGEISQVIMELGKIITAATEARKAAAHAGKETGVKVGRTSGNGGNGTQRDSDLRDEVLGVVNGAPEVQWTATMISKEVSPSPTSGNPRSTGLIANHLESLAAHSQVRQVSSSPKKYQANES